MKESEHVIQILRQAKKATREEDSIALKELSDKTIHSATIHQDEDNALIAVIIYSLSKILEKGKKYYKENYKKYKKDYIQIIDKSIEYLGKNQEEKFTKHISKIIVSSKISGDLKQHIKDLFKKAKINKAGKIYEHGLSMGKTAELLGISKWELAEYTGQSPTGEMKQNQTLTAKTRIKLAEEMFK